MSIDIVLCFNIDESMYVNISRHAEKSNYFLYISDFPLQVIDHINT